MTETRRPKLSITRHAKTLDEVIPLPQIAQGMDRTRRGSEERQMVQGFRAQAHTAGKARGDETRIAACENGDGKGVEIAAFLSPICDHFDLDDEQTQSIAAFTRKLMAGGKPKSGSHVRPMRNVDMD